MKEQLGMSDTPYNSLGQLTGEQIVPAELLGQIKQEMHERSLAEGEIRDLGVLSGKDDAHLWNSAGISRQKRILVGEITSDDVEAGIAEIGQYYVPVTFGAPRRCIDGSTVEGYEDNDPRKYGRPLGPQIQGGSADEAVAHRLVKTMAMPTAAAESTLVEDILVLPEERVSQFSEGDHTDEHADADKHPVGTKTGCGAVDGQQQKLSYYTHPEAGRVIKNTADTIFSLDGRTPPKDTFGSLQGASQALAAHKSYFSAPHDVLAAIRSLNPNGVEKLKRPHGEVSLVLNLVRGTTLHRDHYNARTNSVIQSFGLDVWDIFDENDEETAYVIIADAVATAMDLTDGSLRLLVRVPR